MTEKFSKQAFKYRFEKASNELSTLAHFLEKAGAPKEDVNEIEEMIKTLLKKIDQSQLTTPFTSDNE